MSRQNTAWTAFLPIIHTSLKAEISYSCRLSALERSILLILNRGSNHTLSSIQHALSLNSPRLVSYVLSKLLMSGFVFQGQGCLSLSDAGARLLQRNKQEHKHVFFLSIEEHPLRDSLDWASKIPYSLCRKTDWVIEIDSSNERSIQARMSEIQNLIYQSIDA